MLSDNFEENISSNTSNNGEKEFKPANTISNNNKNSKYANIDQQRPIIPNRIFQNGLLSDLSRNFRQIIFSESEFSVSIPISNTRYKHSEYSSSNQFHSFNN